ncbi:putative mitochondrial carrier protein [Tothia fuscella]|uniref:Mitochondrial carrier protein n=1 Tax=Tothia fuscella TaxID=1048955 RepID=A0A9P4NEA4_9PEZI|nr:putative mitochondrial carrier protein [Tothia fuscella]
MRAVQSQQETSDELRKPRSNAATGASAAGARAIGTQFITFYFRAPAKAFFRTRVDYMAYARAINPRVQAGQPWSWKTSTPGLLAHAVKTQGWSFIPNQILPPMLANVTVGAVLYTSYLQMLGLLHDPSSKAARRVYPPPDPRHTLAAGFAAGTLQSVIAAPLDALQVRFKTNEMLEGRYKNMWHYGLSRMKSIGPPGIFAGWSLSLFKDSLGFAIFFSTFEYVKAQCYYGFVTRWYGRKYAQAPPGPEADADVNGRPDIRPHYLMEPAFLLLAGVSASIAQQTIQHPISRIQEVHFQRLESLDYQAQLKNRKRNMFRLYYSAYERTFAQCRLQAMRVGGWRQWLYKDLLWSTIRQVPSTSAGLIVFEIVRRKYADASETVIIEKDGFDILLT